ncbi:MAG: 1-acyl-sn-glycerol-3-phosphate acyltransferase [Bacteroidales bacterium]|nr:1-acyl-sn-glycerol-3-phosphate acyltransferase [Bacteroidales bacterium]
MAVKKKFIDLKEVIRSKNPSLAKLMPGFILNYIRKTIHEDRINEILDKHVGITGLEFVHSMVHNEFKIKAELHGFENIPDEGRFIFVANHPWGAMEAVTLIDFLSVKFPNLRFIVNDLLMSIKNYEPLFLPVNKHGAQGRENAKILEESFASDKQILIFPAGMVSRKVKGKVMDLEWKKNFISKAIQHKRDVIPIFIDGQNSKFFYRLASFRTALGIKANLEMFYLVDEMMKNSNKSLPYYIGKPISYQTFDNSKTKDDWAEAVKQHVYQLKNNENKSF